MRIDDTVGISDDLIFVNFHEVETDVVSVCVNGVCQEGWNKRCLRYLHVLQRKPKPPLENEYLYDFFWNDVLLVYDKEIQNLLMTKYDV